MSEAATGLARQPLDEVMLAMDVVDTLRHRSKLVDHELAAEDRDEQLMARLRKIYSAQGIEVTDHILREGVAALKEERFVYKPSKSGFSRSLAKIYVSRNRWGKWALGGLVAIIISYAAYFFTVLAPHARLPDELVDMRDEVVQIARVDQAGDKANAMYEKARIALREGNNDAAEVVLSDLSDLRHTLEQTYTLQIVNSPGQSSGVWRVPELNSSARNYYIVVEAIGPTGDKLPVNVINEETGQPQRATIWALRVDEQVFNQIARDKQDDGIIQNKKFGVKRKGYLDPDYAFPTSGAAITQW